MYLSLNQPPSQSRYSNHRVQRSALLGGAVRYVESRGAEVGMLDSACEGGFLDGGIVGWPGVELG
jgi:hypothetical protein